MQSKKPVELLSKHLFWDTPLINVEVEKTSDKSFTLSINSYAN